MGPYNLEMRIPAYFQCVRLRVRSILGVATFFFLKNHRTSFEDELYLKVHINVVEMF